MYYAVAGIWNLNIQIYRESTGCRALKYRAILTATHIFQASIFQSITEGSRSSAAGEPEKDTDYFPLCCEKTSYGFLTITTQPDMWQ